LSRWFNAISGTGAIFLVLRQAQDEENQQLSDLILSLLILSLSKDEGRGRVDGT
jgi:hypothetical protein